jgi:protoporphyrinogen oxidase
MTATAVLGGGISSLAAAYYLAIKRIPVVLIPGPMPVGGWLQSVRRKERMLETGPRSIRHAGNVGQNTLELVASHPDSYIRFMNWDLQIK